MSLQIVFLGTAGSIPTPQRGLPSIAIRRKGEIIIFDCGEGTQRQMIQAGLSFHRETKVFITHMHGDHVLGLPGMLQTMALLNRERTVEVYGPVGIESFFEAAKETVQFHPTFPIEVSEVRDVGVVCKEREYEVHTTWVNHVSCPSLSYALIEKPRPGRFYPARAKALGVPEGPLWSKLQHGSTLKLPSGRIVKPEDVVGPPRPGRKIVYSGDTSPSEALVRLAKEASLLIHEATFDDELQERAIEDGHSTPTQAAKTAREAKTKRLILTHISSRYKDSSLLLEQAKKIFPRVDVAEDLMRIDLPLSDT